MAADGQVRIYEAMDVTSLVHWTMIDSFPVGDGPSKDEEGNHCLSWCTSKFTAQMMVVGCAKDHVAKVGCEIKLQKIWRSLDPILLP